MDRQLVTIENVLDVRPIPDADAIEAIKVRGWTVVAKKGEFRPGEAVVYFEIDSCLPLDDERFAFLAPRGEKVLPDGRRVHVLKTTRLRGQYSQGLVLPLADFPEVAAELSAGPAERSIADMLHVVKWDPPLPASTGGSECGPFLSVCARKTDAERVQNLSPADWAEIRSMGPWLATEKVDGTSATYVMTEDGIRVCSRNWELAQDPKSLHWQMAAQYRLDELMFPGLVFQGEIIGEGIQGNPLRLKGRQLRLFSSTLDGKPWWPDWTEGFAVPTYEDLALPDTIEDAVAQADGIPSCVTPTRLAEGIVWRLDGAGPYDGPACLDGRPVFKVLSNRYLVKRGR